MLPLWIFFEGPAAEVLPQYFFLTQKMTKFLSDIVTAMDKRLRDNNRPTGIATETPNGVVYRLENRAIRFEDTIDQIKLVDIIVPGSEQIYENWLPIQDEIPLIAERAIRLLDGVG